MSPLHHLMTYLLYHHFSIVRCNCCHKKNVDSFLRAQDLSAKSAGNKENGQYTLIPKEVLIKKLSLIKFESCYC